MNSRLAPKLLLLGMATFFAAGLLVSGCEDKPPAKPGAAAQPPEKPATVAVVNARCPIMDNPIDPKGVPAELTRTYKGKQVGFCCAGCPGAWDKLTDEQKDAKLAAVLPAPETP